METTTTTTTSAYAAAVAVYGAPAATFTMERAYGPYGDRTKVMNTFGIFNAGSHWVETEDGAPRTDEDGNVGEPYSRTRTIDAEKVAVLTTAAIQIEARPVHPRLCAAGRTGYAYTETISYAWEFEVSATIGGKPVKLSQGDLARLGQFASHVAAHETTEQRVF
jgi:hypothetical protein